MKKTLSVLLILLLFCSCTVEIRSPEEEKISSGESALSEEEQQEPPPLEGDYVTLEDSKGLVWAKAMEFGETLVFVNDDGTINAYNAESGKKIYSAMASTDEEYIFRIEKYEEKTGFDYRIVLGDGVLYRNSAEPEKELFVSLPGGMEFTEDTFNNDDQSCYDINEEAFVYACEEGIMLADKNGKNPKLVLDNKILENFKEIMPNCEYDVSALEPFEFRSPRFILGGIKIAATVVTWEDIDNGFVVYDIESESIDIGHWIPEPWSPYYTVCDRYVVECGSWVYTGIYDAETKTFTQYKEGFNSGFSYNYATYDFQNVIAVDYDNGNDDPTDYTMMRAYLCTAKTLDDRSRPFVSITDDTTESWVEAIGEKYAIIILGGEEDKWVPSGVYIVKYSEDERNPGESCTLPEDAGNIIAVFEDFDSIYIYDEDSSPLVALTEEERAEFLEIISSYELTETDEADPLIGTKGGAVIITGKEGAELYSNEHAGEGLLYMKRNKSQDEKTWEVSGDLYFDLTDFRKRVQKNARRDGRWPFLSYEEESYIQNLPVFNEEHFRNEFDIFISTVSGEHSIESQRLGVEKAGVYSVVKAYRNGILEGKEYGFDSDGRVLIPEKEIDCIAKFVFGIDGYSGHKPSENGFYTVPFDTAYIKYRIESIETDGSYVICTVNYYDLGDTEFEEVLCRKVFRFIFFEAEGETWYRPTSAYYVFGEEYKF